jgi:hypothetical protein
MATLALHAGIRVRPVIETGESGQIMDFHPGNGLGLFAWVWLQLAVKTQGVVQFLQFGRHDQLGHPIRFSSFQEFGEHSFSRSRYEPMTAHANARRRNSCVLAGFGPKMAIKAGNLHFLGVHSMGKSDGLLGLVPLLVSWQRIALQLTDKG